MVPDVATTLRRWEDAGGRWRVLARGAGSITVGLYRCDGGEEVDRVVTAEPPLADFLAGRSSSEEDPPTTAGTDHDSSEGDGLALEAGSATD